MVVMMTSLGPVAWILFHPVSLQALQAPEHDPEKWIPVFGEDHAPQKG
jgi:hypothetical protein